MYGIYHSLRIRESCRVKLVASPCVLLPMAPIHHNIIYRYIPLSEAFQGLDHLSRCLIPFAALPVPHGPFRHDLGLSGKSSVSADHLVHVIACDEVPVHLLCHLAPPLMFSLLDRIHDIIYTQSAVRNISVRFPFHLNRCSLPCLKTDCELVRIRIPCCPPALRNDGLVTDCHACISCVI